MAGTCNVEFQFFPHIIGNLLEKWYEENPAIIAILFVQHDVSTSKPAMTLDKEN